MPQDPYGQQPLPAPGYQDRYLPQSPDGGYQPDAQADSERHRRQGSNEARLSLILGVVGLFLLGFVLGPLAILTAKGAERRGVSATAGKVLGWIATVVGIAATIAVLVAVAIEASTTAHY